MPSFIPTTNHWRNSGYNYQHVLAWIPPNDFLRLSQQTMHIHPGYLNTPYKDVLIQRMRDGLPIDPLFLGLEDAVITKEVGRQEGMGLYTRILRADPNVHIDNYEHEGRNRAAIAVSLDIPFVPVYFDVPPLKNWRHEYDLIWTKPKVESDILRYLGITKFKIEIVG